MDCTFCKILSGEIPSNKVYEDDNFYAFLDLQPVNKGHTLVIPKQHFENIHDIDETTLNQMMPVIKKVSKAVKDVTGADGLNVSFNNGKAAGQVVFHIHCHIIPRFNDDGLKTWPRKEYDDGEMTNYAENIKNQL